MDNLILDINSPSFIAFFNKMKKTFNDFIDKAIEVTSEKPVQYIKKED